MGLEAQQTTVVSFLKGGQPPGEHVEVESGEKNQRPQLIARLDRLSYNASFILVLRDSEADFVCYDMPDANTLTVGLFAVLAQHERETISKRTKKALAAKKAWGAQLGTPANLTDTAWEQRLLVRRAHI